MPTLAIIISAVVILTLIVVVMAAYFGTQAFKFWILDVWADFPIIGMVARFARMHRPTKGEADTRLNRLFRAYHNVIPDVPPVETYKRARKYLFLAGDADSCPTPRIYWILLIILMAAEAFTFSFLLGVSISPDISERQANVVAVVVAIVLAALFGGFSHPAGHAIRRTLQLRAAYRGSIDPDVPLVRGEKSVRELTELIGLDEDQSKDEPRRTNFDSQRLLNRVRKVEADRGGYFLPAMFILVVLASGMLQFTLRSGSNLVSDMVGIEGDIVSQLGQNTPVSANTFFVLIFFLTQGLGLYLGYSYGFLGKESARAFRLVGGRDAYHLYEDEFERRVRRADESISSLLEKYDRKYPKIRPDHSDYRTRLAGLRRDGPPNTGPTPPSPCPPPPGTSSSGVIRLPTPKSEPGP